MNLSPLEPPFLWPDFRRLAASPGPTPDFDTLFAESQLVLGVVHGLSAVGVSRLAKILTKEPAANQNENKEKTIEEIFDEALEKVFGKKVRLIVTLYPACPTTSAVLRALFQLQVSHDALEVRLMTCEIGRAPENTLACYKVPDSTPIVLFGSSASLEDVSDDPTHLTLAFSPEPILADAWQKWFDVKWLKSSPLTEARTNIPRLVLPEGTEEAARQWAAYEQSCREALEDEAQIKVIVDPSSGEITAMSSDGSPVKTISAENRLPQVSPVYRKLAHLLDQGHLVSVDKTTRLMPFEVSVKPKWFGVETLKQIGSVRRQVSYHISALTENELKQLENRRKKISELLELFSFSLADGQRWMPKAAEELFRQERKRINKEAKGILSELIAGDLDILLPDDGKQSARTPIGCTVTSFLTRIFPKSYSMKSWRLSRSALRKHKTNRFFRNCHLIESACHKRRIPPGNRNWGLRCAYCSASRDIHAKLVAKGLSLRGD